MKKLPFIIGIPAVAVALVLGGAMLWRLKTQTVDVVTAPPMVLPSAVKNAGGTKPTSPFSGLFGQTAAAPTPIPTPTPASVAAMQAEVAAIADDGGDADFTSLQTDVNGL